jgi:hypothetical protein
LTPAVEGLVEFAEQLAEGPEGEPLSITKLLKLKALAYEVRHEDPLALAFQRARAGFRARRSRESR